MRTPGDVMTRDQKRPNTRFRVTFVINSLTPDGAERVLTSIANVWAEKAWVITVITIDAGPPGFPLHPAVNYRPLGLATDSFGLRSRLRSNARRMLALRSAIARSSPHIVISFLPHPNVTTLLAVIGLGLPVMVCERNDPKESETSTPWRILRRLLYPRASRVVVQTERARRYFSPFMQHRMRVIPNPVVLHPDMAAGSAPWTRNTERLTVISMGRLVEQKGFDLLLIAFARVADDFPGWSLEIWGEGLIRDRLEALVEELGIGDRVRMPGRTEEPLRAMRRADLFVLSSRFEGFPNVLCEAMACGLPVISFDCPNGPADIIRHEIDGILVRPGDTDSLAAAMSGLMDSASERRRLGVRAPEVIDRFDVHRVMRMWDELVHEVANEHD